MYLPLKLNSDLQSSDCKAVEKKCTPCNYRFVTSSTSTLANLVVYNPQSRLANFSFAFAAWLMEIKGATFTFPLAVKQEKNAGGP